MAAERQNKPRRAAATRATATGKEANLIDATTVLPVL